MKYALLEAVERIEKVKKPVQKEEIVHKMPDMKEEAKSRSKMPVIILAVAILLGIGSGYMAATVSGKGPGAVVKKYGEGVATEGEIKKGFKAGVEDTKAFPDTAEGVVKEGGIDGEGEYHLERPGGVSQNVYMTSSSVDLSLFIDKKVKVWGSTQTAQKAGWLMDVGKLEVQ